jgi:hypothetical protein
MAILKGSGRGAPEPMGLVGVRCLFRPDLRATSVEVENG